jgi:GH35 family endo-1,4-beta-xylanase
MKTRAGKTALGRECAFSYAQQIRGWPLFPHPLKSALLVAALLSTQVMCGGEDRSLIETRSLKDLAGDTVVCVSTAYGGDNGIMEGPNAERNRNLIAEHFNGIQPAFYPAWGGFWPAEKPASVEEFSFGTGPLAAQAAWAEGRGLFVLHHVLLAPNYYYPDWWRTTDYSPVELEAILKSCIRAVVPVEHVDAWNLINELFLGDGSYFPDGSGEWDNQWLGLGMEEDVSGLTGTEKINAAHPRFIRMALEQAAAHTRGKLEIREGTTFKHPRKLAALYQLALHLKKSGAPLDAVGIQGHLNYDADYDFEAFKRQITRFRAAGVDVYITELDVGLPKGKDPKTADWNRIEPLQAKMYYDVVRAAREAGVSLISVWGLKDASPGGWRGGERALLFDQSLSPKPTYDSFAKALMDTAKPRPKAKP